MKRYKKWINTFILVFSLSLLFISHACYAESSSDDVMKMLNAYKNKEYKKAADIAKALPEYADEKSIAKPMRSKQKKAYIKFLGTFPLFDTDRNGDYLWDYFVKDLDGDGSNELCVYYGSCEADVRLRVYRYRAGKVQAVTQEYLSHGIWCDFPGKAGVIYVYAHSGGESVSVVTLSKNKLKIKRYGSHSYGFVSKNDYKYISFPYRFPGHITMKSISRNGNYRGYGVISYSALK